MAFLVNDRVQETGTIPTGTGAVNLAGAANGYTSFVSSIGNGNTTYYCIYDQTAYTWEVGVGTIASGSPNTLTRTTVLNNSLGTTSPISFNTSNLMTVFCTYPAGKSVLVSPNGDINLTPVNANVNLSPTGGTGTVTINPTAIGSMNNVAIGATTPSTARFTTVDAGTWNGSAVTIPYGGTGATSFTNNGILYKSAASSTVLQTITAPSSAGTYLQYDGSNFVWATAGGGGGVTSFQTSLSGLSPSSSSTGAVTLSGTLNPSGGGTGLSYVGSYGQVLTSDGTNLFWNTPSGGGGLSNAYSYIAVGGTPTFSASGASTINFAAGAGVTLTTSTGAYQTITIAASGGGGGGATWLTILGTTSPSTTIALPSGYDGTGANSASHNIFIGGNDNINFQGSLPSPGAWMSYGSGIPFYTYTTSGMLIGSVSANSGSNGVRFALAPKWSFPVNGFVQYNPTFSFSGSFFNNTTGWVGPMGYATMTWQGVVVLSGTGYIPTGVNCTVVSTTTGNGYTYVAISMTTSQIMNANTGSTVLNFGTYASTIYVYYYYTYQ